MRQLLTIAFLALSLSVSAQRAQCKGTTKAGQPCRSTMVQKSTGYCNVHNPSAKHCSFIKKDKTQCRMIVSATESLCRFHKS